jgi:uncharacterized protein (DUF3084 family)
MLNFKTASLESLRGAHNATLASMRDLETQIASSSEAERSVRLKFQAAQSEITIIRQDKEWYENELTKTREEHANYRREKVSSRD